ncbi:hypothetical protein CQA66_08445 [Helicobacter aurati]|uniref:Phage protein Gp138 N-terminal domain-containing protein n=1 Tax=Helicobacter aurati TaxID=137778 RepID=A0A3D8IYS8_9HELI|nr:Gp138 family membrane-puncturing spike protein [Helicobacter aurati]RDU70428.1 hypothetical protein CQA66_08445 [Helicobacter aurati]
MNDYTGYDIQDLASTPAMIEKLIDNRVRQINTCFIAEVTEINEKFVSVINTNKYMFQGKPIDYPIINNVLVCFPHVNNCKISLPLEVGDIGLCVVAQGDISNFKQSGGRSIPNSARKFDITDSIFIPFSLFNTKDIQENFMIEYKDDTKIIISDDGINITHKDSKIEISEDSVNIESKNSTLKNSQTEPIEISNSMGSLLNVCEHLISMMDLLSNGLTGASSNPAAYNAGKQAFIQQIKGIVK